MFAIEIEFSDGISLPELIFVRRMSAIRGTSENAHVLIEAAQGGLPDVRVTRGLGREFRTEVVRRPAEVEADLPPGLSGEFDGSGEIQFGSVKINIRALDVDLVLEGEETPDVAATRVLKNALSYSSPVYPAIAVLGGSPVLLSFSSRTPITIGRSRNCLVRFDTSDVSSEHARIGCEGGRCWIEDLGSTNGTFVGGVRIEGRRSIDVDSVVSLGSEVSLAIVYRADDVSRLQHKSISHSPPPEVQQAKFPVIFSKNEHVRPTRFVLTGTGKLTVGRDPANDIWINTPHVSRCHMQLEWNDEGRMRVLDESSNGTFIAGERLTRGVPVELEGIRHIDLGGGVELHVAHDEAEEAEIIQSLEDGTYQPSPIAAQGSTVLPIFSAPLEETSSPPTMLATRIELPVIDEDELEEEEIYDGNGFDVADEDHAEGLDPDDVAHAEAEQFQLLEEYEEPLGLGSSFSRVVLVLLIVLLALFSGLVFLGFFADKYFY